MNQMPMAPMMGQPMPQLTPEMIEEAQRIASSPSWEEISAVLQSDLRRCYQVDIETDSTVLQDAEAEKMARMEYMQAMQQMLATGLPAMQQNPSLAPLIKEFTLFTSRAFKIGRTLEETLEEAFDGIKKQPPQPSEAQMKLDGQKQLAQQQAQLEQSKLALEADAKKQQMAMDAQNFQMQQVAEASKLEHEKQIKAQELAIKQAELALKQQEMQGKAEDRNLAREQAHHERNMRQSELGLKHQDLIGKQQDMNDRRAMDAQNADRSHELASAELETKLAPAKDNAVAKQIQELAEQLGQALAQISDQQQQLVQAMGGVLQQEQETLEAVTAIAGHMTAPRKVVRDGKSGRPVGVEIGENPHGDLKTMLGSMAPGQRALQYDDTGRVAGLG